MRGLLTRLVELDPLTASNHCLLGMSYLLGGDALLALPVHQLAVELDPRSTICRVCAAIPLVVAGRDAEAASHFQWLERQQPDDPLASVAVRVLGGLAGDPGGVLSPPTAAERGAAASGEYWADPIGRGRAL